MKGVVAIGTPKGNNNNLCNGIDLAKLAVIAAFLSLTGDFLAFILAVLDLQEQNMQNEEEKRKKVVRQKIMELEDELYNLKRELDN